MRPLFIGNSDDLCHSRPYSPHPNPQKMKGFEMNTISRAKLRNELRNRFGKRKYKIDCNDLVHVYGTMPNTQIVGWWLMGVIVEAELWLGFHDRLIKTPNGSYWVPLIK